MTRRPILPILLLCLALPGVVQGFTIRQGHPRLFLVPEDLPRLRARCGILDGTNQRDYPDDWNTHFDTYQNLIDRVDSYTESLDEWGGSRTDRNGEWLGNVAAAWILSEDRPSAAGYLEKLVEYWRNTIAHLRSINNGAVGPMVSGGHYWGNQARWSDWCFAYDVAYNPLSTIDPDLRDDIGTFLARQTEQLWDDPEHHEDPFFGQPWVHDAMFANLLAIHGDAGASAFPRIASEYDEWLAHAHEVKQIDNHTRVLNFQGNYPTCGTYKSHRLPEDVCTSLVWRNAVTDEDPFLEYSGHYLQLDDAFMWALRSPYLESSCTGDGRSVDPIAASQWIYTYPAASIDRNSECLWVLDRMAAQTDVDDRCGNPWFLIFFDDRTVPRVNPATSMTTRIKHFGDLTIEDGYTSEYTFLKGDWTFDVNDQNSVHVSYFCGPTVQCHEHGVQGYVAIFRGDDIVTARSGVYDRPENRHGGEYQAASMSYNTILVVDRNNPYAAGETDSTRYFALVEGQQVPPPRVRWSSCNTYDPYAPFSHEHRHGSVDQLRSLENGDSYLHSDFTRAYPSTVVPDLWPDGATVENVTRQVMLEAGKFVLVCDRVTSVNPNAIKRVRWHCPTPEGFSLLGGSWTGGTAPHGVQYGGTPGQWSANAVGFKWDSWNDGARADTRVFATVLYPVPADSGGPGRRLVRVGGTNSRGEWNKGRRSKDNECCDGVNDADPSFEFWFRELGFNQKFRDQNCPGTCQTGTSGTNERADGSYGFWYMDTEATGQKDHIFLHVFEATSTSQSSPTRVSYLADVDAEHIGCEIYAPNLGRVNVFSRDEDRDTQVMYRTALLTPIQHLVADLVPGSYLLEELETGAEQHVIVDERSGVASFRTPSGGSFRLTRIDTGDPLAHHLWRPGNESE